jgi:hypothetical protein
LPSMGSYVHMACVGKLRWPAPKAEERIMQRGILIIGLMLWTASPAFAQEDDYPPEVAGITLSDATLVCPSPTTVAGTGFGAGAQIDVSVDGDAVATVTADDDGSVSIAVDVPGGTGLRTITASGGGEIATAVVTCVSAGAGPAAEGVAFTGTNITVGLVILAGLIIAGTTALVVGRRRANT